MKTRLLVLAVALGVLAGFGVAAGACTSDGKALTLEEYFQQLDELDNRATQQFGDLDSQLGDDPDIDTVKEVFPQYVDVVDEFLADLEDIEPPDEAKDAHDEAIEAGQAFRDALAGLVENAGHAETVDEVFAGFESEAFTTADQRFTDACLALEGIAGENSITVDLDCEDDDGSALTLEEYFQQLDEVDNRSNDQFGELDSQLGDDRDIDAFKEIFPQYVGVFDDFLADLNDIEPPDEARDAHNEAIEAGQAFREEFAGLVENAGDAETIDELFAATGDAFSAADQRFTDACLALQGIADENSITVDLTCGDE